jgi:hypothetical protein
MLVRPCGRIRDRLARIKLSCDAGSRFVGEMSLGDSGDDSVAEAAPSVRGRGDLNDRQAHCAVAFAKLEKRIREPAAWFPRR